jgi:hypothetical protein
VYALQLPGFSVRSMFRYSANIAKKARPRNKRGRANMPGGGTSNSFYNDLLAGCDFFQHVQRHVGFLDARRVGLHVRRPVGGVTTLDVDDVTDHRHHCLVAVIADVRTVLEDEHLPEFTLAVFRVAQVGTREIHFHVHHLLAVGVLRRADALDHVHFTRLPADVRRRVEVRRNVDADAREALGRVREGLLHVHAHFRAVRDGQHPALLDQLVRRYLVGAASQMSQSSYSWSVPPIGSIHAPPDRRRTRRTDFR